MEVVEATEELGWVGGEECSDGAVEVCGDGDAGEVEQFSMEEVWSAEEKNATLAVDYHYAEVKVGLFVSS